MCDLTTNPSVTQLFRKICVWREMFVIRELETRVNYFNQPINPLCPERILLECSRVFRILKERCDMMNVLSTHMQLKTAAKCPLYDHFNMKITSSYSKLHMTICTFHHLFFFLLLFYYLHPPSVFSSISFPLHPFPPQLKPHVLAHFQLGYFFNSLLKITYCQLMLLLTILKITL